MSEKNKKVSIIIRCKNEDDWIGHCLEGVFNQSYDNFEVIIVDNESTDNTLGIIEKYPVEKVVTIKKYLPGLSINDGIRASSGEIIAMLSAHCIPKGSDWLSNLVRNFESSAIAGVYGRQLPLSYSSAYDVRDLLITFGLDKRVQEKDYFFHNANSAILRKVWDEIPFDESATNIEDRIWAKQVTQRGMHLVYEPEAEVYHHHGIHQAQNIQRARTTLEVLKNVEEINDSDWMPESLKPENRKIIALLPIKEKLSSVGNFNPLLNCINLLNENKFIDQIYFISKREIVGEYLDDRKISILERPDNLYKDNVSFVDVLQWGLSELNDDGLFPDYIIYLNPEYLFRPEDLIDRLIHDACFKGLDTVFVGYEEFANHWHFQEDSQSYQPISDDLRSRSEKRPTYKSLFGQGLITKGKIIKKNQIISNENVGVISTNNFEHTLRISDPEMLSLIDKIL